MKQPEDTLTMHLPLPHPSEPDRAVLEFLDSQPADIFVPAPDWRRALDAAIASDPRGRQGVAERLEVSRGYVSRVAGGDLTACPPARFIERVEATLMELDCPFMGRRMAPAECRRYASRSYAQVSQFDVPHWRACRACPSNPNRPAKPPTQAATQAATQEADT
jgi:hypothetical protein